MKAEQILKKAKKKHKHIVDDKVIEETIYWFGKDEMREFIMAVQLEYENKELKEALEDIIHVVNDLSTTTSNDHTIISHAGYDRIMEYEKLLNKQ